MQLENESGVKEGEIQAGDEVEELIAWRKSILNA